MAGHVHYYLAANAGRLLQTCPDTVNDDQQNIDMELV